MGNIFIKNDKYCELLLENADFNNKVRAGSASYLSEEWKRLQRELTDIEIKMSAADIICHAEYLFPKVEIS